MASSNRVIERHNSGTRFQWKRGGPYSLSSMSRAAGAREHIRFASLKIPRSIAWGPTLLNNRLRQRGVGTCKVRSWSKATDSTKGSVQQQFPRLTKALQGVRFPPSVD